VIDIESGLQDRCVLQRNSRNVSDAAFSGTTNVKGEVQVRVTRMGKAVKGFGWKAVGTAGRGKLAARLAGLPCGGPYDIRVRIGTAAEECIDVTGVLVGDVWIAAGQSNMQGCGVADPGVAPHPLVRALYMNDRWDVAKDPIHNLWECVDEVHVLLNGGAPHGKPTVKGQGVGPAVAFAQEMHRLTGVPQGILACGHGGTSMAQWDPAGKKEGTRSLYGATIRRVRKCGGKVAGMIWYQGESDANKPCAAVYTEKMRALVASLRRDCGEPALPVVIVQIARVATTDFDVASWNDIQEQERRLDKKIRNLHCVPAIDLALDDLIHIGGADHVRLGKRLASAMANLKGVRPHCPPPIAFKDVKYELDGRTGGVNVRVEFENVAGNLTSAGTAAGFAVTDPGFRDVIFKTTPEGNAVVLGTSLDPGQLDGKYLHYGYGINPFCTITDELDRSLPVFGPVPLSQNRALTPFAHHFRVSDLLAAPETFDAIGMPTAELRSRQFPGEFCDMHAEIGTAGGSRLVYFACGFECPTAMKLAACIGYDGPLKLYVDGKQVFADPAGTNPALPDKAIVPFAAAVGRHEVVLALHTNEGRAWGVRIRLERLDVTKRQLKEPTTLVLPTWVS
jgi:sialate O-acetylesterase